MSFIYRLYGRMINISKRLNIERKWVSNLSLHKLNSQNLSQKPVVDYELKIKYVQGSCILFLFTLKAGTKLQFILLWVGRKRFDVEIFFFLTLSMWTFWRHLI